MDADDLFKIAMNNNPVKVPRSVARIRAINTLGRCGYGKEGVNRTHYGNYTENEIDVEKVYNAILNGKIYPGALRNLGVGGVKEICKWVSAEIRLKDEDKNDSD